ncbi:O-antigen polymerase [Aliikangiella maris]|uniref:O-antigen polymerase n=2 Tax=Aliikangiella maris TaxID=3162458 RepID=A0ABV3MHZ1_9GAMM
MSNIVYTLLSGIILLNFSYLCYRYSRSVVSPAFTFSSVWAVSLVFLSITPLMGFYAVNSFSVLIFIFGAIVFSLTSLSIQFISACLQKSKKSGQLETLNYDKLLVFFIAISIIFLPLLVIEIMSYGSSVPEIAYNLRQATLNGEKIGSFFTANYFVIAYFLSILFIYAISKKLVRITPVILSLVPFLALTLLLTGRSALISLILAWVFTYVFSGGKISIKVATSFFVAFMLVLVLGATLVSKVDVAEASLGESIYILLVHIVDYLFQGPVLFSHYFDNQIHIRESWDTLNSVCHALSKLGLCTPISNVHADDAYFGNNKLGNVYSMYFAIFPHYSYIGIVFFIVLYSSLCTYFFEKAKHGSVFSLVASGFLYSAIVLSIYKDGFGSAFWLFIKFYLISIAIVALFSNRGLFNRIKT